MQLKSSRLNRFSRGNPDSGTGIDWAQGINAVEYLAGTAIPELSSVEGRVDYARRIPASDLTRIAATRIEDRVGNLDARVTGFGGNDPVEISLDHPGGSHYIVDISQALGEIGGDTLLQVLVEAVQ